MIAGPNVLFTSTEQFISKSNGKASNSFEIEFELNGSVSLRETFKKKPKMGIEIAEMTYQCSRGREDNNFASWNET